MRLDAYDLFAIRQNQLINELLKRNLAIVIPIDRAFLNGSVYRTVKNDESYFSDRNHLSEPGALRAMTFVAPLIWQPR